MITEQPIGLPRSKAQIVGGDLEQLVVEQQPADVELGMAACAGGDHQLRRLPVDQATELGFGERRGDHVEVVDDQRDALARPRVDSGGERRRRRAVELHTDGLADNAGDLGEATVGRDLQQIGRAPRDRRGRAAN